MKWHTDKSRPICLCRADGDGSVRLIGIVPARAIELTEIHRSATGIAFSMRASRAKHFWMMVMLSFNQTAMCAVTIESTSSG